MDVAAIIGSLRKESYNKKVVEFMQSRYERKMEIEILHIRDLPHFDQDVEEDPPQQVKVFKQRVAAADAILIATPEYNHSVPGVLKNALDWLSRVDKVLTGKPVLLIGSTPGMLGTVRAQIHLRQILASPGLSAKVLPGNEVLINFVHEKLDDHGRLVHQQTISFLDDVVNRFIDFVNGQT
ncbi:NAD(P)H-dependent FMN reductase [Caldalkalibacillus uzonensis]|uniref:NAD(P)H-dependent FMN reductase n=1 Tax=Caldalkalibacillus uzonensis TaxID=353224 RepID=A0ABU0CPL7_9BACI|nr:NAD(P)H-dependent oxidoreductase [Caldalkalibacillus uzonensis]MDQ0338363.1 NAD(P)H-dependent FMN reductase [Caldalkalibacillus uzonensis]